jgi:alpha/beta superfamily hydrolase
MKVAQMKEIKYIILLSTFLLIIHAQLLFSQSNEKIKGNWLGTLRAQGLELRVVFKVSENEDGTLKATLDSPDQGAFDIPIDSTIYDEPNVRFVVKAVTGFYEGKFEGDSIVGTWTQSISLPLTLTRTENVETPKRPQEPKPPFPYNEEEVSFANKKDALTLSGTFTFPKEGDLFPTVILISGSGPENRNEEVFGHKPFLVLADYLTRNGIAVLRFDDRGVGKSSGNFSTATTEDFVTDVLAGVEYLKTRKEVDKDKIGLIGHSEGGLIAPLAAVQSDYIDFIILMAAPGMRGKEILRRQTTLIMRANGYEEEKIKRDVNVLSKMYEIIVNEKDTTVAKEKLKAEFDKSYADLTEEEGNGRPGFIL